MLLRETLRNDVEEAFERLKRRLKEDQGYPSAPGRAVGRKVISRAIMPFEYANGRVMFDASKTRELMHIHAAQEREHSVLDAIAEVMIDLGYPKAFTAGYVRTANSDHVFTFVYMQD